MTIKECIDIVDNIKPNQYSTRDKVMWLSFIDETIVNDVLKTHEGYDGRYDDFIGYTEDKLSVTLIVPSPYDRLYTAYLKMKIDGENGETARYNNSAALFNNYMMEYRKYYNKTHMPLDVTAKRSAPSNGNKLSVTEAQLEFLKRELYHVLSNDLNKAVSDDKIYSIVMSYMNNNVGAFNKGISEIKTANGTVVSQNADFAEVAEWADGNPNNEDRTGYFVCANVPVNGIVMKKATSVDDVKGVTILAPAFAGNYSKDKLDGNGNLLPKYSYVAIIGFVPVIDNGTCTVGGRCMPDDNGCAVPSNNSMGYQVINRIDEKRVLIIIEPNGDMVQRIKDRVNQIKEEIARIGSPNIDTIVYDSSFGVDFTLREMLEKVMVHDIDIAHMSGDMLTFSNSIDMLEMPESPDIIKVPSTWLMKEYVEGKVGNIETALDSIIAMQESLIGGAE